MAAATIWFVRETSQILWLFAAGFFIAYLFDPILDRLEARHWSRGRAVATVAAGVILIGLLVASWLIPALVRQVQSLAEQWPRYNEAIEQAYVNTKDYVEAYAVQRFPELDIAPFLDDKVDQAGEWLSRRVPVLVGFLTDNLVRSVTFTGLLALLAIISIHFMLVIDPFRAGLRSIVPRAAQGDVQDITREVSAMLGQYLRGQATMMLAAGIISTGFMVLVHAIFGSNYSLIVGLITGVTYVVPWVGAAGSVIAGSAFSYVSATHDPLWAAGVAALLMIATNQICDQLVMPKVIGRQVGLHPLAVIFGILAGLQVLGVVGIIIATPTVASIKIILARWLPLKRIEPKPGKPEPLLFDLGACCKLAADGVHGFTRRIENAIGMDFHRNDESSGEHEDEDIDDDGDQEPDDPATP